MSFVYDRSKLQALNPKSNSVVRYCHVPTDMTNALYYEFSRDKFFVRFEVWTVLDLRTIRLKGKEVEEHMLVALLIEESSLRLSFLHAISLHPGTFTADQYPEFRELVQEGLLAISSQGGAYFERVPDFQVRLVQNIPKNLR